MTYAEIQRQVAGILGVPPGSVRGCWIADVKRERGDLRGPAPNRGKGRRAPSCPATYRQAISRVLEGNGSHPPSVGLDSTGRASRHIVLTRPS